MSSRESGVKRENIGLARVAAVLTCEKRLATVTCMTLLICAVLGIAFPAAGDALSENYLYPLVASMQAKPALEVIIFIIINNLKAALLIIGLGILAGIPSLFFLGINGFLIGAVMRRAVAEKGIGVIATHLFPHGIFEIPAILIATIFGMRIGIAVLSRERVRRIPQAMGDAIAALAYAILPLLVLAGIIEGTLFALSSTT